jgi:hypothetical protein
MKHRLMRALLLGVPAAATFAVSASVVQAAEECRLKPDSTAPSGRRWVYRINRADHRHCWYLSSKAAITRTHLAHRYRHLAGDPEAARQDQQGGDRDLQTTFAPPDKTDVAVAAKPPPMPQAATPSTERSPDDIIPRSVPTVVYRLPTGSAQTVTAPTVPALSVRTVTPAATSKSNVVLLAGAAAAALCFAGGVFHFTRRIHRSQRLGAVADGHGVRELVDGRSLVAIEIASSLGTSVTSAMSCLLPASFNLVSMLSACPFTFRFVPAGAVAMKVADIGRFCCAW